MDDDEVITAVVSGETISSIAQRRGVSRQAIEQRVRRKTGMKVVELRGYKANSWAHTHHDDILKAYRESNNPNEVARSFHISVPTLYKIIRFHDASKLHEKQRAREPLIPKAQALLDRGYSLAATARELNLPLKVIAVMRSAGEITPFRKRHERRFPITRESLEAEAAKGGTLREIATVYGCSPELIAKRLDEYGIPRKKRTRWREST